jgi:hypothetical protein
MPWNVSRSAQFYDKEILAYPQWGLIARSVVIDATMFAQNTDVNGRTVVPAGTILKLSVTNAKRYVEYDGTGKIQGILTRQVELLARASAANEPAAMYFHEAVFATTQIVGFTTYASALVADLDTCKWV